MDDEFYEGREHAEFKHFVLSEYLKTWGIKLGSRAQREAVTLWYVDGFAGPWEAKAPDRRDSSAVAGVRALKEARNAWGPVAENLHLKAALIEKDDERFREVAEIAKAEGDGISIVSLHGDFVEKLPELEHELRPMDGALFFLDPYGWKDASIELIRPLAGHRFREVLINLMSPFAHRASGMKKHAWMGDAMRAFFALEPSVDVDRLTEEELVRLYRRQLCHVCGFRFAVDILIPDPVQRRPKYRLVLGTKSEEGVRVFRDVEDKLRSRVAQARAQIRFDRRASATSQMDMFGGKDLTPDKYLDELKAEELAAAERAVLGIEGRERWEDWWPRILEDHHIRETQLKDIVARLHKSGRLVVEGWVKNQRKPRDGNVIYRAKEQP